MEKTIKINIPEGYTDCKFNNETNTIEFIKKDKPRNWEQYCKQFEWTGNEYYLYSGGVCKASCKPKDIRYTSSKAYFSNKEDAEAFLALIQLRQLRKAWVGDWEPVYKISNIIWTIYCENNNVDVCSSRLISRPLSFPTEEIAQDFLYYFRDLIETAKILL